MHDVVREGLLDARGVAQLQAWVGDVQAWPTGSHVWGHYAEETPKGPAICRTENVSACHPGIAELVRGPLRECAASEVGASVTDFKDKCNYKQPGGAGFRPHQDRVAYPGVQRVVSILLAIDECNLDSGCLWLADGVDEVLPVDERGVVRDDVATALSWYAAELHAGDAVVIDGLAPHYSEANRASAARRVLVASYAPASEGYTRAHYYAARQAEMQARTAGDGRFRISTLADFDGTEVAATAAPGNHCTHP